MELPVLNIAEARFECTFGRGCEGICCREGRPPVYPEDSEAIAGNLDKFIPLLRPEARLPLEREGFVSRRVKAGQPMMRVVAGWCIFFNKGCVLHQVGAAEGDPFRYKPALCSLFPLSKDTRKGWYIRQKGVLGEEWELPCLDPMATTLPAAQTLAAELALAERFEREAAAERS